MVDLSKGPPKNEHLFFSRVDMKSSVFSHANHLTCRCQPLLAPHLQYLASGATALRPRRRCSGTQQGQGFQRKFVEPPGGNTSYMRIDSRQMWLDVDRWYCYNIYALHMLANVDPVCLFLIRNHLILYPEVGRTP